MIEERLKVVPTSREVIEGTLLTALQDEDIVAVLLSRDDLCMIQHALGLAPVDWGEKRTELLQSLRKLKEAAFGT